LLATSFESKPPVSTSVLFGWCDRRREEKKVGVMEAVEDLIGKLRLLKVDRKGIRWRVG
jgi:hypothetical protein